MNRAEVERRAQDLGVEMDTHRAARVVVTGYAMMTPLGGTQATWDGLLVGRSGATAFNVENHRSNIAAPLRDFRESEITITGDGRRDAKIKRSLSRVSAAAVVLGKEAGEMAGLLSEGRLAGDVDRHRVGSAISSGIAGMGGLVDAYTTIYRRDAEGCVDPRRGSSRIRAMDGLQTFPEEVAAAVPNAFGLSGWSINSMEACATGASSIVEATRLILEGRADAMLCGGVEDPLGYIDDGGELVAGHGDVAIALFSAMGALSTRDDDPGLASRPFDRDRDGFVLGAGGAVVVLESLASAQRRGATIYGEVLGFHKSIDGGDDAPDGQAEPRRIVGAELNRRNVARTVLQALWNEESRAFRPVDAIFAHATSTPVGDLRELQALRLALGEDLASIPIAAIKGNVGHQAGGAGAINAVVALQAMQAGLVPPILNLETVDPDIVAEVGELHLVRGHPHAAELQTALALSYGFGGFNAALLLGRGPS
jgi:3-oxoacyl-[acyl-carrier-protein] synthase II